MIRLRLLVRLQWVYAAAAIAYLLVSAMRLQLTGQALSAAPILLSIVLLLIYAGFLVLPYRGRGGLYRIGMLLAVILFGGGGVAMNIIRFVQTGLEHYASMPAFVVAVLINAYGTALNVIALFGWFRPDPTVPEAH